MTAASISVVIPTRNRRAALHRLLGALAADSTAPAFDVVVVDDGSSDDTVDSLATSAYPFPLTLIAQHAAGAAAARNVGAQAARGDVLLFLDDDVEPLPGALRAHMMFHRDRDDLLGIGDLPPVVEDRSLFGVVLRGWWSGMLDDVRRPGHRFSFRNVLTGHLSCRRSRFVMLDGFEPTLHCHEDWEFGYRALKADMQIAFVAGAVARHHEVSDLAKVYRRKFDEGVADVQLAARHPELTTVLPLSWPPQSRRGAMMMRLGWRPRVGELVARLIAVRLMLFAWLRLRGRWRATLELMLTYWYWRGVASQQPSFTPSARRSADDEPLSADVTIDLSRGIAEAEACLDRQCPASAALFYDHVFVGIIPATPGLEPLRGGHLRRLLATKFRRAFGEALVRAGAAPSVLADAVAPSAGAGGAMLHPRPPVMRDEELAARNDMTVDPQHRATIPPVHDVA